MVSEYQHLAQHFSKELSVEQKREAKWVSVLSSGVSGKWLAQAEIILFC